MPFDCNTCSRSFRTNTQRDTHAQDYHSSHIQLTIQEHGEDQIITIPRVNGWFECPECDKKFATKTAIRRHADRGGCSSENQELQHDIVTIPESSTVSLSELTKSLTPVRDHDFTVLQACQQLHGSEEEKIKTLYVVEALKLSPITLKDALGIEHAALAHPLVTNAMSRGQVEICATAPRPKKRRLQGECASCSPHTAPGLENLLATSPYMRLLSSQKYVELADPICDILSEDWTFRPQLRYAVPQLLAGCILYNTSSGQAIMANTIEIYGRTKSIDAHREPFLSKKGVAVQTSLPPPTNTRYKDTWPLTLASTDGERLVIGTQSCNALITSSLRLDSKEPASVGGTTTSFILSTPQDSKATRIYLDCKSVETGLALATKKDTSAVSNQNMLGQLRQVRSKFYSGSTYMLCRVNGHLTRHHTSQPYNFFNLINYDQSREGDGTAGAGLFNAIAKAVLEFGPAAVITKDMVQKLRQQCSTDGNIGRVLDSILALFSSDVQQIVILGNMDLNSDLEDLAQYLSSWISVANKSVVPFINQCFTSSG